MNQKKIDYKEFPNFILNYVLVKFKKVNIIVKVLLIIVCLLFLFFVARLGFFGEPAEKVTFIVVNKKILPTDEPYISRDSIQKKQKTDSFSSNKKPDINSNIKKSEKSVKEQKAEDELDNVIDNERLNLSLNFLVNEKQGILNRSYYSGDQISLIFNVDIHCYIMLICIDNHDIYDLLNNNFSCQFLSSKEDETIKYNLDNNIGHEAVIIFASKEKFNYENEIKPYLNNMQNTLRKGPDLSKEINLNNKKISHKIIYYNHR
ncbi:MAG: hypothetical protein WCP85_04000 [Mariniphaga sp.]